MDSVKKGLAILLVCSWAVEEGTAQNRDATAVADPAASRMTASPVESDVTLDGLIDEDAWSRATPVTDFIQFEPDESASATQRTEVRILYGANSLFVGAVLYDESPELIERALGRRDEYNRADWFLVSIDSYLDRRTAYTFGVNAAGVQFDALRTSEGGGPGGGGGGGNAPRGMDPSWDAVWYSDVRMVPDGWSVELRIPYSMLRFSVADTQTWGIHFTRQIPRLGEIAEWPFVPRTERANLIAQFGQLTGITRVAPRRNIQVRPYSVARLNTDEHADRPGVTVRDAGVDAGGDLKIGLGPNVTLDATINPDFGQVESDPAVLNLTAFETSFDERRPFFVEGIQIYQFSAGPGELLYTRRVGADVPIVGAAKLSGRTEQGLSFGVLGATTGDDFRPSRHYGVARLSRQFGEYSTMGGILTAFDGPRLLGEGRRQSVVGGADWDVRFRGNRYGVEGFLAVSHRQPLISGLDTETGIAGKVWARKRQGAWTGFLGLDVFGDSFNPNDVGQLNENNFIGLLLSVDHEINEGQPFGPFLRASLDGFHVQRFSYDEGLDLGQQLRLGSRWTLQGFQQIELGASVENLFGGYDLYETRGLGPWALPARVEVQTEFQTDERRSWEIEPEVEIGFSEDGGRSYAVGLRGDVNAGTRVSFSGNIEGEWEDDMVAWSSNEVLLRGVDGWSIGTGRAFDDLTDEDYLPFDDGGLLDAALAGVAPVSDGRYVVPVFGARDTRSVDFTVRSTVTFTPNLSVQVYGQLFLARGRYHGFRLLQDRDHLAPFDTFPKRDEFAFSSLQSNVVFRWEYRPGSTLFLVWTHGRRANDTLNPLAPWGPSPYNRPLDDHISDTFDLFPSNVFLVKLNYTFLY